MAVDDWRSKGTKCILDTYYKSHLFAFLALVFDGIIQEKDYNKKWWEIREKYTGEGSI